MTGYRTTGNRTRGEDRHMTKLTNAQALAIFKSNHPSILAKEYGVSQVTATHIRTGKTWDHVTGYSLGRRPGTMESNDA